MSNGAGFAALERFKAEILSVDEAIERAAPDLAEELQASIRADLSAGRSPDGEPWAPGKDGGRVYAGAAGAVTVASHGPVIVASLEGPEVWGHKGVRGAKPRPMLPTKLPARFLARARAILGEALSKHLR